MVAVARRGGPTPRQALTVRSCCHVPPPRALPRGMGFTRIAKPGIERMERRAGHAGLPGVSTFNCKKKAHSRLRNLAIRQYVNSLSVLEPFDAGIEVISKAL